MILAGLFTLLSTTSTITALVGQRIFPVQLPEQSVLPALTYQIIAVKASPTLTNSGYQRWRLQFDCWGKDYADATNLRAALRLALEGYRGTLSDGTLLQDAQMIQLVDYFEHDSLHWRSMIEFYLFFNLT